MSQQTARQVSLERAEELKSRIAEYLKVQEDIQTGFKSADTIAAQKKIILEVLGGTEADWDDWHWQMDNRITDVDVLANIINLSDDEYDVIKDIGQQYRWAISPYYASLMDPDDRSCPIRWLAVPSAFEYSERGELDPMAETTTSPAPAITRRYPDRLIIKVTNQCAMYCRHCQRRRAIGELDKHSTQEQLTQAVEYVRDNPEIRDVLITGGDAFMLEDETIEWLLKELNSIEHVEMVRLGTRTLVTLPQRVTPKLAEILSKYHPVYVNSHFNHPKEVTNEAAVACDRLSRAGVPLGNQAVLLNGINSSAHVMKKLNQELLRIRVRPYYMFHAKVVRGTLHFHPRVETGLEIMEQLRGFTSGMAIPTYIINAPGGLGKTPILPNYLVGWGSDHVMIRTWEGNVVKYPNFEGNVAQNIEVWDDDDED